MHFLQKKHNTKQPCTKPHSTTTKTKQKHTHAIQTNTTPNNHHTNNTQLHTPTIQTSNNIPKTHRTNTQYSFFIRKHNTKQQCTKTTQYKHTHNT